MGNALYHLERYEDAHESLTRALSLKPDPAYAGSLWRLTGRAAQALGRPEEAARHYERALELDPHDAEAVDLLAMLRFREQRYALALGWYRKLTEISPESARSHANLGVTLYHPDRIDEAIRSFGGLVNGYRIRSVNGMSRAPSLAPACLLRRTAWRTH